MTSSRRFPELIAQARRGDEQAIGELFQRCEPRVRGLVAVRMGRSLVDLSDQEDLVQESLLTALGRLQQFEQDSEGALVCWLAAITTSRVRDARRRARAEKRGGGATLRRADLGITTLSALPAVSRRPSPSNELARRELQPDLERALLRLAPVARRLVYCRLVLEMSHQEMADELGLAGADSARAQFHKAMARLRAMLDGTERAH